jgi:hypothetical protein
LLESVATFAKKVLATAISRQAAAFPLARVCALLCLAITTTRCTTVEINGASGTTTQHLGILRVIASPQAPFTVIHTAGIGVVPSASGLTVGTVDETTAVINNLNDCRVAFIFETEAQIQSAVALLKAAEISPDSICQIKGPRK